MSVIGTVGWLVLWGVVLAGGAYALAVLDDRHGRPPRPDERRRAYWGLAAAGGALLLLVASLVA